jgi:hypothetical protein
MKAPFRTDEGENTESDCQKQQKGLEDLPSSAHITGKLLKQFLFTKQLYVFVFLTEGVNIEKDEPRHNPEKQ